MLEVGQHLYRLVDKAVHHSHLDHVGEYTGYGHTTYELQWEIWVVQKLTPKGYWVIYVKSFWHPHGRSPFAVPEVPPLDQIRIHGHRQWINPNTRSRLRLAPTFKEAAKLAAEKRAYHVRKVRGRLAGLERRLQMLEDIKLPEDDP